MTAQASEADELLALVREAGMLRPKDLIPHGISRTHLGRLRVFGRLGPAEDRPSHANETAAAVGGGKAS